jgi:hypothetical protein
VGEFAILYKYRPKWRTEMGILDIFTGGIEADDVNVLPIPFIHIYLNPHRALGLDEASTNVNLLRETFRKLCLGKLNIEVSMTLCN